MKRSLLLLTCLVGITITTQAQKDEPLPPPPPPPPKVEIVKYNTPVIEVTGAKADAFYKRNPAVSSISRQGNVITLKMKDKTTEKYNMSKKEEEKNFTDKYGESPIPNPPPPPPKPKTTN